ncbi:Histone chaperone asf1 [Sorochytrium milnesiophthora]
MSVVNIADVRILRNNCPFLEPFEFEISFECLQELKDDLDFKVIYVSSAVSEAKDQTLESVSVGPIPVGVNKFVLEAPPPNASLIDRNDLVGVTVVLLQVSYMGCEFVRIGYLVNNEYTEEELKENPPDPPVVEKLYKNILAEKPRVTRFHINWENPQATDYSLRIKSDIDDHMQEIAGMESSTTVANGQVGSMVM